MAEQIAPSFHEWLSTCFDQNLFCDIAVIATMDGKKIMAHRIVLAATSDYFDATDAPDEAPNEILVAGISGDLLEILIKYCYTQQIVLSATNVRAILEAADDYRFVSLKKKCEEWYLLAINVQSVFDILEVAEQFHMDTLCEAAQSFAHDQFLRVIEGENFLRLSAERLAIYLRSDDIQINAEEDVFNAICAWIRDDLDERRQHYGSLMGTVRMSKIPSPLLYGRIQECSGRWNMQQVYREVCAEKHRQDENVTDAKRMLRSTYMFVAGRRSYDDVVRIERYSIESNAFEHFRIMDGVEDCNMHCIDNSLFLFTRRYGRNGTMCIPFNTLQLEHKTGSKYHRQSFASAAIGFFVYIIGGTTPNTSKVLGSVERYDIRTDTWIPLKRLNFKRSNAGAAVLANKIYLVGGRNRDALTSVECYDPAVRKWAIVADLNKPRAYFRACTVNGVMYAFGGWTGPRTYLSSIERYDEQIDKWTIIPLDLGDLRSGVGLGIYGDWIYIAGGRNGPGDRHVSNGCRRLNIATGRTEYLSAMNEPMQDVHCAMTSFHFD